MQDHDRFTLGDVSVTRTDKHDAGLRMARFIDERTFGYICFMDARTAYLANHDRQYCLIQNRSLMTLPDGMPLVWFARWSGFSSVERVSGKDFMDAIFSVSVQKGYSHYFYGSTPDTIARIRNKLAQAYPGISVLGAVSPPFQPLDAFDVDGLARELNLLKPTFFWCGLGAPKQERFIAILQPKLDMTFCAGVGLAFEYLAGTVRRAPEWMRHCGFEWLYRLAQQPRNIARVAKPFLWIVRELIGARLKKNGK